MIRVAIIDTGAIVSHRLLKDYNIQNMQNISDEPIYALGHGTAVCAEIISECPEAIIDVYPLFNAQNEADPEQVVNTLQYIAQTFDYQVINLSLGISDPIWEEPLYQICKMLTNKGVIIVSAFDNYGSMSYPACFDNVIGVDISELDCKVNEYYYLDNDCINVVFSKKQRKIAWDKPDTILSIGSSFCAAYITGIVCKHLCKVVYSSLNEIRNHLRICAKEVRHYRLNRMNNRHPTIKNGALFPVNKEIITTVKLSEFLKFRLTKVMDFSYSKNVHQTIEAFSGAKYTVESIKSIDFNQFDTLIIGHIEKYIHAGIMPMVTKLLNDCIVNNKRIYGLDDFLLKQFHPLLRKKFSYPKVLRSYMPRTLLGKLWNVPIPVIGILGTSSQQGKFSTQVRIVNIFEHMGYKPGFIATEPTGYLFGADFVFPYGYNANLPFSSEEYAIVVNQMIRDTYKMGKDVIFIATQSATVSYNTFNMSMLTSKQLPIIYGSRMDAAILCVSPDDEIDYIHRTIEIVRNYTCVMIIGMLIHPRTISFSLAGTIIYTDVEGSPLLERQRVRLQDAFNVPVFIMNSDGTADICKEIINALGV